MPCIKLAKKECIDLVLYHAKCADGFGAAYAAHKYLGNKAEYVACVHGDEPPPVVGKNVLVLDFSFPRDILEKMYEDSDSLLVLDHHISAQKALGDLPYACFDMSHSGAVLAWKYFFDEEVPLFIRYIEDRDLWKWEMENSKEFSAALNLYPFCFQAYQKLEDNTFLQDFINKGTYILECTTAQVDRLCKSATRVTMHNYNVLAVNSPIHKSEIGSQLSSRCDFVFIWHYDHTDSCIKVSLRSRKGGVNVSEVARAFGGGGHKNAAGFKAPTPSIFDILFA